MMEIRPPNSSITSLTDKEHERLAACEAKIKRYHEAKIEAALALLDIYEDDLFRERHANIAEYAKARWSYEDSRTHQILNFARVLRVLRDSTDVDALPSNEAQTRPLTKLSKLAQIQTWNAACEHKQVSLPTGSEVKKAAQAYENHQQGHGGPLPSEAKIPKALQPKKNGDEKILVSLPLTQIPIAPSDAEQADFLVDARNLQQYDMEALPNLNAITREYQSLIESGDMSVPKFNRTNLSVDWAWWTWNPLTGCAHGCDFCYAREIANRFYPQGFTTTFYPNRLLAPGNMEVPDEAEGDVRAKSVFVSSMGDLFGGRVADWMIEAVLDVVRKHPEWNFLFLTKHASRLSDFSFPDNAWIGTSVVTQKWVEPAEQAFADVDAAVKWLSCEPLLSRLDFERLDLFDLVVAGGQSSANGEPAQQPEWAWVEHLTRQTREAGCRLYFKDNLTVRPQELPERSPAIEVPRSASSNESLRPAADTVLMAA